MASYSKWVTPEDHPPQPPPEPAKTPGGCCLAAVLAVPAGLLTDAARGFVLWVLYGWFVVPLGAPALSWAAVTGLYVTWSLLRNKTPVQPPKIDQVWVFLCSLTASGTFLLLGWLCRLAQSYGW